MRALFEKPLHKLDGTQHAYNPFMRIYYHHTVDIACISFTFENHATYTNPNKIVFFYRYRIRYERDNDN